METVLGIVILVLNLVGVLGLGIAIEHWFLTLVGYFIALVVLGNINENVMGIVIIVVSVITLIAIIRQIVIKGKRNKLLKAVKKGDKFTVRKMIEKGTSIEYYDYKEPPLSVAVENGDKEMVTLLLEKINNVDYDRKNPLSIAAEKQDKDIIYLLVGKGADIKKANLLQFFVENNDKEMVTLLLEKEADVNLVTDDKTPLDCAKNEEMITLLRNHGAKTKKELDEEAEEAFLASEIFYNAQDYKKTVECLEKAVSLGHIGAHNDLAIHYIRGLGVEEDWNKVYELSKVAAKAGSANSQVNLGNCYSWGKGTYQSDSEAIYWWEKAAEQGNTVAMYNIGNHYYTERDAVNAKIWLEKAAELGEVKAMFYLGECYRYLLFSASEAGKWYEKAARNGHVEALVKLKELCGMGLYNVGDDY